MQVYKIQNNNTSFNAQLKVDGVKLSKRFQTRVEKIVKDVGNTNDVVSIKIGRQYNEDASRRAEDNYHIINFKKYFRDISITSVINSKPSKYCKTFEYYPKTKDTKRNIKSDIISYLKLLKSLSNES